MAVVLTQLDNPISAGDRTYVARVCGREMDDGLWEGWIEFDPGDGSPVLRTQQETTQPNYQDLDYWSGGLSFTYLEGALRRALSPATPDLRPREVVAHSASHQPATHETTTDRSAHRRADAGAVLDPFEVFRQGEAVLLQELGALGEGHLRNIVREYDLIHEEDVDLLSMHRRALADLILAAVRKRSG